MTGPEALGTIFLDQLLSLPYGQTVLFLLDEICFSYHALSVITLYITNTRFRNELKAVFEISSHSDHVIRSSVLRDTSANHKKA